VRQKRKSDFLLSHQICVHKKAGTLVFILGFLVQKVNVSEARQHISRLLDAVTVGEEFLIVRSGRPVAMLTGVDNIEGAALRFPDREELRKKLLSAEQSSGKLIREMRDERY
jgi:prevent-host-death family protein